MNEKTSINSTYLNLWAPSASPLQGLIVMQQCVYQIKFKSDCDVKKQLVQPGLVWTPEQNIIILLSINKKMSSCWCSHSGPTLQAILMQTVKTWTTG